MHARTNCNEPSPIRSLRNALPRGMPFHLAYMPKVVLLFLFCFFDDTTHSDLLWFDFVVLNNTAWADQVAIAQHLRWIMARRTAHLDFNIFYSFLRHTIPTYQSRHLAQRKFSTASTGIAFSLIVLDAPVIGRTDGGHIFLLLAILSLAAFYPMFRLGRHRRSILSRYQHHFNTCDARIL